MTKRRASIRGRGAEILFGEPAEVEIEPRAPGETNQPEAKETETGEPVTEKPGAEKPRVTRPRATKSEAAKPKVSQPRAEEPPGEGKGGRTAAVRHANPPPRTPTKIETLSEEEEADIEEALRAEALDGAPRSFEPSEPTMLDVAPPLTAEMEVAFIEEAYGAEVPPEPVDDVPIPTMEERVPEGTVEEGVAMYEAPPAEVGSVTSGVVPPRPDRRFFEMEEPEVMLARDIQAPQKHVETIVLPERPLTDAERAEILARLGEGWIQELQAQIDVTYESVRRTVGENEAVALDAFNTLLKARDILVMRKIDQLAQAEYYLELVRARLKRVSASESAAKRYQWPVLGWGMVWGIAFLVGLILLGQGRFRDLVAPAGAAESLIELDIFVSAMLWGGVGGAVAVLYSLFKHVGERDFDSQFLVSYIGKPFLGLISGAIIYMAFNLVIRALGIYPSGMQTESGDVIPAVAPGVVYLVALAAGFKETRLLTLIDTLWDQIFGGQKEEEENVPDAAVSAS